MKSILSLLLCFSLMIVASPGFAWNLAAKNVGALRFLKDGAIYFVLYDSGDSGPEFLCKANPPHRQWFYITACGEPSCIASVDRMASMLLAAKMAGRKVYVQRSDCEVTQVALSAP